MYGSSIRGLDARIQSSTLKAHSLLEHVDETFGEECREKLYAELNRRHFCDRGILNSDAMLADAIKHVGIAGNEHLLAAKECTDRVLEKYNRVLELGIHSIPTLIIDGRLLLSGASRENEVLQYLKEAVETGISGGKVF